MDLWEDIEFTKDEHVVLPLNNGKRYKVPLGLYYTHRFPKSCSWCPVGFMNHGKCGRNIPFEAEDYEHRPLTCKLRLIEKDFNKLLMFNLITEYTN